MAVVQTTISAAVGLNDLIFPVTSATGIAAGYIWKLDNEYGLVTPSYVSGTNIPVYRRGDQGSTQSAHNALAIFKVGSAADWAAVAQPTGIPSTWPPVNLRDQVTYSVSGAIAVPVKYTVAVIDKGGVAVMTLAAPDKSLDGVILTVTSVTAQAHTVTATGLFSTGTASVNLATFAASKGSGFSVMAMQGLWNVLSSPGITFS